jgi:hypothetical protein
LQDSLPHLFIIVRFLMARMARCAEGGQRQGGDGEGRVARGEEAARRRWRSTGAGLRMAYGGELGFVCVNWAGIAAMVVVSGTGFGVALAEPRLVLHGLAARGWFTTGSRRTATDTGAPSGLTGTADDFCWRRAETAEEHDCGAPGRGLGASKALRGGFIPAGAGGTGVFFGWRDAGGCGEEGWACGGPGRSLQMGRRFAVAIPETSSTIGTVTEISDSTIRFFG